jgi:hypothetical protein
VGRLYALLGGATMSDFLVDGGLWGKRHIGQALPVIVGSRTIGSAYVDDKGDLHVHVDDPSERYDLHEITPE